MLAQLTALHLSWFFPWPLQCHPTWPPLQAHQVLGLHQADYLPTVWVEIRSFNKASTSAPPVEKARGRTAKALLSVSSYGLPHVQLSSASIRARADCEEPSGAWLNAWLLELILNFGRMANATMVQVLQQFGDFAQQNAMICLAPTIFMHFFRKQLLQLGMTSFLKNLQNVWIHWLTWAICHGRSCRAIRHFAQ